jgi:osmotically-inducible protein OsmY
MRLQGMRTALATTIVAFTVVAACSRPSNPENRVSDALKQANIDDVRANYDSDSKVVHLNGNVQSTAERDRAGEVAERAVGTSGKVLNEVTVENIDKSSANDNDGQIRSQLNDMVDRDPQLTDRSINFDVNNGAVEIKGTVASAAEKNQVTEMARSVAGVRDVANGLTVDSKVAKGSNPPDRRPAAGTRDNPR